MTNEEMIAKYESMNSMEDAYAMMKENGYTGTMQDFEALCAKAADEIGPMELDDMDDVAGGISWEGIKEGAIDAWDTTMSGFSKGWNWVKANPDLTAEIGAGVVAATIGITCGVKYIRSRNAAQNNVVGNTNMRPSLASISSDGSDEVRFIKNTNFDQFD